MPRPFDEIPSLRPELRYGECHRPQLWSRQRSATHVAYHREHRGEATPARPTAAPLNEDGNLVLHAPEYPT